MRQIIRDDKRNEIGYTITSHTGEIKVYDKKTRYLGKCNHHGTFNADGKIISPQQVPGLLLGSC